MVRTATRELTVEHDAASVGAAIQAALAFSGARTGTGDGEWLLRARTGSSGRSWGEDVTVELAPVEGGTHVRPRVATVVGLTLIDFGATRKLADRLVHAADDPVWAEGLRSRVGQLVLPKVWVWSGVVAAAGACALTWLPSVQPHRVPLLVTAGVAAALWTVAVLTRSLLIRRRGQFVSPWMSGVMLAGTLVVGFGVSDTLKPRHAGLALSSSADLSACVGALALTALSARVVRRMRGSAKDVRA